MPILRFKLGNRVNKIEICTNFEYMKKLPIVLLVFVLTGNANAQNDTYKQEILLHREEYKNKFLESERSPLGSEDLKFLQFFEPNEAYRVICDFVETPDAAPFDLPTYSGITKPYVQFGWLKFKLNGKDYSLAIYQNLQLRVMPKYRDYLFLPFKDETNGEETYGGGRYLDFQKSDIINNRITLDFNKAYNPWCAYSDGFNCPIPPKENHLAASILAGERQYVKHDN